MEKDVGGEHVFVVLLIGSLIILGFILAFPDDRPEPIRIGWIGPLSGDFATSGAVARSAAALAAHEVNQEGGINGQPLELIFKDGGCDSRVAADAAQELIFYDDVPLIIGGACTSETLGFVSMAEKLNRVVVSYCTSVPPLTKLGDHIFRTYPSDTYQAAYAANYLYDQRGARRVALLSCKQSYCSGIRTVFKEEYTKLGGSIVADEWFEEGTEDFRPLLEKLRAAVPDALYLLGYTEATIGALQQIEEMNWDIYVFGADAWDDPKILAEAGAAAEGRQYSVIATEHSEEFAEKIRERTAQEVTSCAPQSYDTVKIVANLLQAGVRTPEEFIAALHAMPPYEGVSGTIEFDEQGDLVDAKYAVKEFRNGRMVLVR